MTERDGVFLEVRQDKGIPLDARIECHPGELLALVGPSGGGKSTLLRSIAGLNTPDQGRITCGGEVWLDTAKGVDIATRDRHVGMVFQNYALFPHLTAEQNIRESLGHIAPEKRPGRARELLSLVHLSGLEERKPAALSGGQQQRVAVARALGRDPKVLLLDEPFSAVDKVTRQRLYTELVELRQQFGIPMILVTHDLDEAAMLADRLCILHRGRTLQNGPPYDVLGKPTNREIARLVDLRNIFQGTVIGHDEEYGQTNLSWGDYTIAAGLQTGFKPGKSVDWVIPTSHVILAPDQPSILNPEEGIVQGVVTSIVRLGDLVNIVLDVKQASSHPLFMTMPWLETQHKHLMVGDKIWVSLVPDGIHLMEPGD